VKKWKEKSCRPGTSEEKSSELWIFTFPTSLSMEEPDRRVDANAVRAVAIIIGDEAGLDCEVG